MRLEELIQQVDELGAELEQLRQNMDATVHMSEDDERVIAEMLGSDVQAPVTDHPQW